MLIERLQYFIWKLLGKRRQPWKQFFIEKFPIIIVMFSNSTWSMVIFWVICDAYIFFVQMRWYSFSFTALSYTHLSLHLKSIFSILISKRPFKRPILPFPEIAAILATNSKVFLEVVPNRKGKSDTWKLNIIKVAKLQTNNWYLNT